MENWMKSVWTDTVRHSVIKCLICFNIYPERGIKGWLVEFLYWVQLQNHKLQSRWKMLTIANSKLTSPESQNLQKVRTLKLVMLELGCVLLNRWRVHSLFLLLHINFHLLWPEEAAWLSLAPRHAVPVQDHIQTVDSLLKKPAIVLIHLVCQ